METEVAIASKRKHPLIDVPSQELSEPPSKRCEKVTENTSEIDDADQHVQIQFMNPDTHETCGNSIRVPMNVSTGTLTQILTQLRRQYKQNDEENSELDVMQYNFYVGAQHYQLLGTLSQTLKEWNLSVHTLIEQLVSHQGENIPDAQQYLIDKEISIPIMYEPQATYRVRPVTRCSSTLPGHESVITTVQFNHDGSLLASGGGDRMVRFWDMSTELPDSHTPSNALHLKPIQVLQWSPCGTRLASADMAGHIAVWERRENQDAVEDENDSKDTPSSSSQTTLEEDKVWRLLNNRKMIRGNTPKVEKLRWSRALAWKPLHLDPDARYLVASYQDGAVHVWDCFSGQTLVSLNGNSQCVPALRWGGTDLIYTVSHDHDIRVFRAKDGALCRTLKSHSHWINCLSLNVDAALRTGYWEPKFASQAQKQFTRQEMQEFAQKRYDMLKGDSPERLVVGSDDKTLSLWEPEVQTKPINKRMTGHMAVVNDVRFSPDGRLIASASFDKSIKIWDGKNGSFLSSLYGHVQDAYLVAWSSDSRMLISASKDSTLQVFSIEQVRRSQIIKGDKGKFKRVKHHLHNLFGHSDQVFALDWSPDGQRVASAGADCILKIWRP